MSTVLRDVGLSLVGGWVLPHEGTILQKHIRHASEWVYSRGGQPFQSEGQMRLSGTARGPECQTKTPK